jgi:hypothetical protein
VCVSSDINWIAMYIQMHLIIHELSSDFSEIQLVLDIPEYNNCSSFRVSVEGIQVDELSDQSYTPAYSVNFSHLDSSCVYHHSLFSSHPCIIYSFCDVFS